MKRHTLKVTPRELAHVLVGLRLLQTDPGNFRCQDALAVIVESEGHAIMTAEEVDELAARLNR